jgi:hypothetical protein
VLDAGIISVTSTITVKARVYRRVEGTTEEVDGERGP